MPKIKYFLGVKLVFFCVTEREMDKKMEKKGKRVEGKFSLRFVCQNHIPFSLKKSLVTITKPTVSSLCNNFKNQLSTISQSIRSVKLFLFTDDKTLKKSSKATLLYFSVHTVFSDVKLSPKDLNTTEFANS